MLDANKVYNKAKMKPSSAGNSRGSNSSQVNSSAVVTYSSSRFPTLFSQLSPLTNLNLAPSNWLRKNSSLHPNSYLGPNQYASWTTQDNSATSKLFPSFQIADNHLNVLGEIDVISDAENVKKLMKMPYSKSHISMAIHRLGKTLLLEPFDVHQPFNFSPDEIDWIKDICKQLTHKDFERYKKTPSSSSNKRMFSKFLHHSIEGNVVKDSPTAELPPIAHSNTDIKSCSLGASTSLPQLEKNTVIPPVKMTKPIPLPSKNADQENDNRWQYWNEEDVDNNTNPKSTADVKVLHDTYDRTLLWTFDDLQMLLGTNLPIFGCGEYPAVTLRLRESNKPISILTGLDYWLDNLICNVPEVVMCFHVSGIVQNYEVIKTEDIPDLKDSKFKPKVIKDIAQNILSFLKSNCTKEGHTYWLFKGNNDDVIKLYDITSLSNTHDQSRSTNSSDESQYNNPFTIPVTMLMYKMATNMLQQPRQDSESVETAKKLLHKCLTLLQKDTLLLPVMLARVMCMLSCLCISDVMKLSLTYDAANAETNADTKLISSEEKSHLVPDRHFESQVTVSELSIPNKIKTKLNYDQEQSLLDKTTDNDAFKLALDCIMKGFEVFGKMSEKSKSSSSALNDCIELLPIHIQLVCNTSYIYLTLAKHAFEAKAYGKSMRYISIALQNEEYFEQYMEKNMVSLNELHLEFFMDLIHGNGGTESRRNSANRLSSLLMLCGDVKLALIHLGEMEFARHQDDYSRFTHTELTILDNLAKHNAAIGTKYKGFTTLVSEREQALSVAYDCYQIALRNFDPEVCKRILLPTVKFGSLPLSKTFEKKKGKTNSSASEIYCITSELCRKLGHIENEQGAYELNKVVSYLSGAANSPSYSQKEERQILKACHTHFCVALNCFTQVNDFVNQALVLSNNGRLMRVTAQSIAQNERFMHLDKPQLYTSAIDYYLQALSTLQYGKDREKTNSSTLTTVHDNISWELSSTYFTLAQNLQDDAPVTSQLTQADIENKISNLMSKSLKYCSHIWKHLDKADVALHRSAEIHHRLASMHHNTYLITDEARKRKHLFALSTSHYEKSATLFLSLKTSYPCEFLRAQLERLAIVEDYVGNDVNSPLDKFKQLSSSVSFFEDCLKPLNTMMFWLHQKSRSKLDNDCCNNNAKQDCDSSDVDFDKDSFFRDADPESHLFVLSNISEAASLVKIYTDVFHSVFRNLIKISVPKSDSGKKYVIKYKLFKEIYAYALRSFQTVDRSGITKLKEMNEDAATKWLLQYIPCLVKILKHIRSKTSSTKG